MTQSRPCRSDGEKESSISLTNRRRGWAVDLRLLRRITRQVLEAELKLDDYELGIFLVGEAEMTRMNEGFLKHAGSTDVITFDYAESQEFLHGELFICLDEAEAQARRYRTSWQSELTRYVIHGLLHLRGYDDLQAAARRKMKREEDRVLRAVSGTFSLRGLGRKGK